MLHGGPAVLLGAARSVALRAANAYSLLETGASLGWRIALELERRLSERVPVIGASLVLNQPQLQGAARGYPYEVEATERIAGSPFRHGFRLLPGVVRDRTIRSIRRELGAVAAFAAAPSVAHAEALLRAVEARSATLDEPLDAICIGIPRTTPHLPRERPNPLLAAYLGLGLALRLWRDRFPLVDGGTVILLHRFHRHFAHPTQQPYRAVFQALRTGPRETEELARGEHEPRPTLARSPPTARAARATRYCRSPTGPGARPRSAASGRSSSPAAAMQSPRASSASFRPGASAPRSRWPAA